MLIDCDVHPQLKRGESLVDYVPPQFRDRFVEASTGLSGSYPAPNNGRRVNSIPDDGNPSGSDPELFDRQLLGDAGVDFAVHICDVGGSALDPDLDWAIKRGMNEWIAAKWIGEYNKHGRYRAAVNVSMSDAALAVDEIEHWAGHPNYIQLLGNPKTSAPFGHRQFHPIWEAAARHNLPFSIHKASVGLPALLTPAGYCSYYPEIHSIAEATVYVAHCMSFICEGVFDKYPSFKVIFIEGGFGWVGPLLWRLEKMWDAVRREFPRIKRRPSDYFYDNIRFTTQPVEEPERKRDLNTFFEMVDAERLLMFATDYPHWDYDDPQRVLTRLSDGARQRIAWQNAADLYGLPVTQLAN